MSRVTIVRAIRKERDRQEHIFTGEAYTTEHDDRHDRGELAQAAACYAAPSRRRQPAWPFEKSSNKKAQHTRTRQLIIAAAFIIAELERLERLETP